MAAAPRTSSAVPPSADGTTAPSAASVYARWLTAPWLLFAAGAVGVIKWVVAMWLGIGDIAHVFLLVSLMLLMLAGLKARDAAARAALASDFEKR